MMHTVEMPSCGMILIPSFINISAGVQPIFRVCLRNLRGCNVGITDGEDL
jgi:hypothetical protein